MRDWRRDCSRTVVSALEAALAGAAEAGADLEATVEIVGMERSLETLVATVGPEVLAALEPYLDGAGEAVPDALLALLDAARKAPASDYDRAQAERRALRDAVDRALAGVDAIAMPTSLDVAWPRADIDPDDMGFRDTSTYCLPLANLTGHPAISIPAPTDGVPVGLQLLGVRGGDEQMLEVAAWLEAALAG